MAWPKGTPRPEGAGRKKGTPNKFTQDLMKTCEEMGVDPFKALILKTLSEDESIAMKALSEVCQYLYPKRKAIEHSGEQQLGFKVVIEDYLSKNS